MSLTLKKCSIVEKCSCFDSFSFFLLPQGRIINLFFKICQYLSILYKYLCIKAFCSECRLISIWENQSALSKWAAVYSVPKTYNGCWPMSRQAQQLRTSEVETAFRVGQVQKLRVWRTQCGDSRWWRNPGMLTCCKLLWESLGGCDRQELLTLPNV